MSGDRPQINRMQLQQIILNLSLEKQRSLYQWLGNAIAEAEKQALINSELPLKPGREVIEQQHIGQEVYQLEKIRCGKPNCKCADGDLHGPYWYGYQRHEGKVRSWYVGKTFKRKADSSATTDARN